MTLDLICTFIAWMALAPLACSMPITLNNVVKFTVTSSLTGSTTFTFTNNGQLIRDSYAVLNFNSLSDARLPLVTVTSYMAKDDEHGDFYFSNFKNDWTFDENILVVPLVNAEKFSITVAWRVGSSGGLSLDGLIGVFAGSSLAIPTNFFAPVIVPESLGIATVTIDLNNPADSAKPRCYSCERARAK